MQISGQRILSADPATCYAVLSDPDSLRRALPGCETLIKHSETEYDLTLTLALGVIRAHYDGTLTRDTDEAPDAFSVRAHLTSPNAGHIDSRIAITLLPTGDKTELSYCISAVIGGRLSDLGQSTLQSLAAAQSERFFAALSCLRPAGLHLAG